MGSMVSRIGAEFHRYKALGEGAFEQLEADELGRGDAGALSIATLVWHVSGNLASRFTDFLESDGEKPWRDREGEFEPRAVTAPELREKWERGWGVLEGALRDLRDEDLSRTITIRGVGLRVDEALLRALAHVSYHVGQIVYVAKGLRGADWRYLSIPPGGTAAYAANPDRERAPARPEPPDARP